MMFDTICYSSISNAAQKISPGVVVAFCFAFFFDGIGGNSCADKTFRDLATNICTPCNHCCFPRPTNLYCERDCDLTAICAPQTTAPNSHNQTSWFQETPAIWISITIVFLLILLPVAIFLLRRKRTRRTTKESHIQFHQPTQESRGNPFEEDIDNPLVPSCHDLNDLNIRQQTPDGYKSVPTHPPLRDNHMHYNSMPVPNSIYKDGHTFIRSDIVSSLDHSRQHSMLPAHTKSLQVRSLAVVSHGMVDSPNHFSIQCEEDVEHEKRFVGFKKETDVKMVA